MGGSGALKKPEQRMNSTGGTTARLSSTGPGAGGAGASSSAVREGEENWLAGFRPALDIPARPPRPAPDLFDYMGWYDQAKYIEEEKAKTSVVLAKQQVYRLELDKQLSELRGRKDDRQEAMVIERARQEADIAAMQQEEAERLEVEERKKQKMRLEQKREEEYKEEKKKRDKSRREAERQKLSEWLEQENRVEGQKQTKRTDDLKRRAEEMKAYVQHEEEEKHRKKLEEREENRRLFEWYIEDQDRKDRAREAAIQEIKDKQMRIQGSMGKALGNLMARRAKEDEDRMIKAQQEEEARRLQREREKATKMAFLQQELLEVLAQQQQEKREQKVIDQKANMVQAEVWKKQAVETEKAEKEKAEKARKRRQKMDVFLVEQMQEQRVRNMFQVVISPRAEKAIQIQAETSLRETLQKRGQLPEAAGPEALRSVVRSELSRHKQ